MKRARQGKILELINRYEIETQEDLAKRLLEAGIPVTHRNTARSFHVITAHTAKGAAKSGSLTGADGVEDAKGRFVPYGALEGTLVFLMGVGELPALVEQLLLGGKSKDTPAALV